MAMGVVSEQDFENELARLEGRQPILLEVSTTSNKEEEGYQEVPEITAQVMDMPQLGRGNKQETPQEVREEIAKAALSGTDVEVIASHFDISKSSISAYKKGATSTTSYNDPDEELKKSVDLTRKKISGKAQKRLMMALNGITPEGIAGSKLRDISGIAKDMSIVMKNMEPSVNAEANNNIQFVIMAPPMRDESKYEVIELPDSELRS